MKLSLTLLLLFYSRKVPAQAAPSITTKHTVPISKVPAQTAPSNRTNLTTPVSQVDFFSHLIGTDKGSSKICSIGTIAQNTPTFINEGFSLEIYTAITYGLLQAQIANREILENILSEIDLKEISVEDVRKSLAYYREFCVGPYEEYGRFLNDTFENVVKITGAFRHPILIVSKLYITFFNIILDGIGMQAVDNILTYTDLPGLKGYLQIMFSDIHEKLREIGAFDYVKNAAVEYKTTNQKYGGKYANVSAIVELYILMNVQVTYKGFGKAAIEEVSQLLTQVDLTILPENNNFEFITTELEKYNVSGIVNAMQFIEMNISELHGFSHNLLQRFIRLVLLELNDIFSKLSQSQLEQVSAVLNEREVFAKMDDQLDSLEQKIVAHGYKGPLLGVSMFLHSFANVVIEPYTIVMKGCAVVLMRTIESVLQFVDKDTATAVLGKTVVNYKFLTEIKELFTAFHM